MGQNDKKIWAFLSSFEQTKRRQPVAAAKKLKFATNITKIGKKTKKGKETKRYEFVCLTLSRQKRRQPVAEAANRLKGNAMLMFGTNITKRGKKENIATIMPPKVKVKVDSHH